MKPTSIIVSALVLVLGSACGDDEPATETQPAPPVEPAPPPTKQLMAEHFRKAWAARDAIIRGDFEAAKTEMRWLAEHDQGDAIPEEVRPKLAPMQQAAQEFVDASTLSNAGASFAKMLDRCGDCHGAVEGGPRFEPGAPPEGEGTEIQMQRHRWAADRMWEGMVQPDPQAFARAADVLASTDMTPPELGEEAEADPARVRALVEHVHEMAAQARDAENLAAREQAYGRFIASCAACHRMVGKGPGQDSEPTLTNDLVPAPGD